MSRTTLYVNGFDPLTRARDLAWEFERYGPLVRCDIPALKTPTATPYAFVEYRYERDAEDAYHYMHRKRIDGFEVQVQWSKRLPSRTWRTDGPRESRGSSRRSDPYSSRSRRSVSPYRSSGGGGRDDRLSRADGESNTNGRTRSDRSLSPAPRREAQQQQQQHQTSSYRSPSPRPSRAAAQVDGETERKDVEGERDERDEIASER